MKINALKTITASPLSFDGQGVICRKTNGVRHKVAHINPYNESLAPEYCQLFIAAPDLLSACESALRVFKAWQKDTNPHGDLKRGDSADYDAACDMAEMMLKAIDKATKDV